jgi:DNA segregation ATPase FtsK/SpoIIIE-like protein
MRLMIAKNEVSVEILKRQFRVGDTRAVELVKTLELMNCISKPSEGGTRKVLMTAEEFLSRVGD